MAGWLNGTCPRCGRWVWYPEPVPYGQPVPSDWVLCKRCRPHTRLSKPRRLRSYGGRMS